MLAKEHRELSETPQEELRELTATYQAKGLSPQTAQQKAWPPRTSQIVHETSAAVGYHRRSGGVKGSVSASTSRHPRFALR